MASMEQTPGLLVKERPQEWQPKYLDLVAVAFVTCLLVSNLAAVKLFKLGPLIFTCGVLVFPLSYIFGDVLTEVYGYARARRVIWCGLLANIFMTVVLWIAIRLPPAPDWALQEQFRAVHEVILRIVTASIVGYWAGQMINSIVMSVMKVRSNGRLFGIRAVASTAVGEFVDSTLFILVGFLGKFPAGILVAAILSAWLFKTLYEIVVLPVTYKAVGYLKHLEGIEHFDRHETYNPLKV